MLYLTHEASWNVREDKDFIRLYKKTAMSLNRESLILFGLLMGGDYDNKVFNLYYRGLLFVTECIAQKGVIGCGMTVARAVVSHGFGDSLCYAVRTLSPQEFDGFLVKWRNNLKDFLREDPAQSMGSRHPALAAAISDSFPDPAILVLYLFPTVSPIKDLRRLGLNQCAPDIVQITRTCELHFSWATRESIIPKFERGVFQAVLMAVLRQEVDVREARHEQYRADGLGVRAAFYI
jgi:holliday junction resolvase YEN1